METLLFPLSGPVDLTESKNISTLNLSNPFILKRGQTFQFHRMFMGVEQFRLKRNNIQTIAKRSFILLQSKFEKELEKIVHYLQYGYYSIGEAKKLSKKLFYEYYRKAYFLGLKSAGAGISQSYTNLLFKDSSSPTIHKEEERWSQTAAAAEVKFWGKFLNDVNQNILPINKRIKMYTKSLEGHYNAGRVAGSPNESLIYWIMDKSHTACSECEWLATNGPWPKENLITTPKAGLCSCLMNCRCSLKIVPTTREEYIRYKANIMNSQGVRKLNKFTIF